LYHYEKLWRIFVFGTNHLTDLIEIFAVQPVGLLEQDLLLGRPVIGPGQVLGQVSIGLGQVVLVPVEQHERLLLRVRVLVDGLVYVVVDSLVVQRVRRRPHSRLFLDNLLEVCVVVSLRVADKREGCIEIQFFFQKLF
jgi:hypothetical protein